MMLLCLLLLPVECVLMSRQRKSDNVKENEHSQPTNLCREAHKRAKSSRDKTGEINSFLLSVMSESGAETRRSTTAATSVLNI